MPKKFLFSKSLSVFQLCILCIVLGTGLYFALKINFEDKISNESSSNATNESKLKLLRNHKYKFTRPILSFDMNGESKNLEPICNELKKIINENCTNGNLFQASVYLRDLETGEYTTVNEEYSYHPGSLIKVPMLIYYLKESENNPDILTKKLRIDKPLQGMPAQTYSAERIEMNKDYTVKELLKYMAAYSDNNATYLLNKNCDEQKFTQIFGDLNLTIPNIHDTNYTITVRDYSLFMRVLYNATYLNNENSDFALSLLAQSSFTMGMISKLPPNIIVAHKFGEMKRDDKRELHESGIIYCNNKPYVLTIMTKGYNAQTLAGFIGSISDTIFHFFCV